MTIVTTMATTKDERLYVRVKAEIKTDFEAVADYRGLTPSALLHSLVVKTVREARKEIPEIFSENKELDIPTLTVDEISVLRKKKK